MHARELKLNLLVGRLPSEPENRVLTIPLCEMITKRLESESAVT